MPRYEVSLWVGELRDEVDADSVEEACAQASANWLANFEDILGESTFTTHEAEAESE